VRVWAAHGLLWCWDDVAFVPVKDSLSDDAWRVREVALRVIARHRLVDTASRVADLQHDPSERVRTAAARALKRLAAAKT
jgi:HEAT repeat protein